MSSVVMTDLQVSFSCKYLKQVFKTNCIFAVHTQVQVEEGDEETWQRIVPPSLSLSLTLISVNIPILNPAGDVGNRAGRLPRWNIGFCLLPPAGTDFV